MNLKQLEVFLSVAETGSFSKGAEASFITQSTVSQHVAALERELNVRLLDRTGKGVFLTEGGKILQQHAQRLVEGVREIRRSMDRFNGLEEAHLKVGGSNIPGSYLVPAALPLLVERFPGIRLTLIQGDSAEVLERISREEVEIGVVGGTYRDDRFTFSPIGRDDIRLVVNSRHPWRRRKSVSLEEVAGQPFILRETGSGTGKTVEEALLEAGLDPRSLNVRARLGSNEAVKRAVAEGIGVSFLSLLSIRREITQHELGTVDVEGLSISRQFHLASRAARELSPAAAAFGEVLREVAALKP